MLVAAVSIRSARFRLRGASRIILAYKSWPESLRTVRLNDFSFSLRSFSDKPGSSSSSSSSGPKPEHPADDSKASDAHAAITPGAVSLRFIPQFLRPFIPTTTSGFVLAGSAFVGIGMTRIFYGVTTSFLGLTPAGSLYYGFVGGLLTAASSAAVIYIGERSFRIHPDHAVNLCLPILNKNKMILELFGSHVTLASTAKTYSLQQSTIGLVNNIPTWINPNIQLVFTVRGKRKDVDGIVTVVYRKAGLAEHIDYLAVDVIQLTIKAGSPVSASSASLVIVGHDNRFTVRNLVQQHAQTLLQLRRTSGGV